jgi:predicted DNA-binding transcriptional regulator AlpA
MEQLLSKADVSKRVRLSTRSIDRRRIDGTFPRGFKVGAAVRWRAEDIDEWIRKISGPVQLELDFGDGDDRGRSGKSHV